MNNTKRQTHFDDGGFNFLQNTVNLDLTKSFKKVAQGLNLGLVLNTGMNIIRFMKERKLLCGISQLFWPGPRFTGIPRFSPNDVIKKSRSNLSAYVDAEPNVTKEWLVDGALRFENYRFRFTGNVQTGNTLSREQSN